MASKKGKGGIGGFLKGAVAGSKPMKTTEAELLDKAGHITPEDVLGLGGPTEGEWAGGARPATACLQNWSEGQQQQ